MSCKSLSIIPQCGSQFGLSFPGSLSRLKMCFLLIQELFRNLPRVLPSPPNDSPLPLLDALPASRDSDARSNDSRTDGGRMLRQDASASKPQTNRRTLGQTSHYPHNVQSDQLQRSAVLGPPGSQGGKPVSQAQKDDRVKKLERRLEELARMLDMVKAQVAVVLLLYDFMTIEMMTFGIFSVKQNADLQSRVQYLEGCECVRQRCVWEGREVEVGQRWRTDLNTVCTCTSGKVTCQADIKGETLSSFVRRCLRLILFLLDFSLLPCNTLQNTHCQKPFLKPTFK